MMLMIIYILGRLSEHWAQDGQLLKTYSSVKEASEEESISLTGIYSACTGKQKTAGGYIWKYS